MFNRKSQPSSWPFWYPIMADVLTVRPGRGVGQVRLCLATRDAAAYAADVPVSGTGWQEVRVPLTNFRPAAPLPRPYPGFLPLPYAAPRRPRP